VIFFAVQVLLGFVDHVVLVRRLLKNVLDDCANVLIIERLNFILFVSIEPSFFFDP